MICVRLAVSDSKFAVNVPCGIDVDEQAKLQEVSNDIIGYFAIITVTVRIFQYI